jgi:hypothetical protein
MRAPATSNVRPRRYTLSSLGVNRMQQTEWVSKPFFQDVGGRAIWKIDVQGKLTKYDDELGGHWMALDADGTFSRADPKIVKRITPFGAKPTLLVADGGAPIVVNSVYVLEYTNANGGRDEGWLPRVRKLGRDGRVTTLATVSR